MHTSKNEVTQQISAGIALGKPALAVIILNWNAAEDTIRCVRSVQTWQDVDPTVYVVDNASRDGSAQAIATACPHVHLIRNRTNRGFAGGNNPAIRAALAAGDAPILLLNNDASLDGENAAQLLHTLRSIPQAGFVGPLLFDAEQPEYLLSAGGRSPLHHHTHVLSVAQAQASPTRVVDYIPGTVILIKAEVFRTVGMLDEAYFFNTEVADLCLRGKRHGYDSVVDTRTRAYHSLGRSSHLRNTLYTYYTIRNRFLYIRKFHPRSKVALYGIWGLYSLALAIKEQLSGNTATAKAMRLGLQDGLQGRFGGQNARVLALCGKGG